MSDDLPTDGIWNNYGHTLPDDDEATYNVALSPIFFGRTGGKSYSVVIGGMGTESIFWSSSLGTNGNPIAYSSDSTYVSPSRTDTLRRYGRTLRCLVSTNNRIIINLVSDEVTDTNWSNVGFTFPEVNFSTHNPRLSPLFISISGSVAYQTITVNARGSNSVLQSSIAKNSSGTYYFLISPAGGNVVLPSYYENETITRANTRTLRCLVSTNNIL